MFQDDPTSRDGDQSEPWLDDEFFEDFEDFDYDFDEDFEEEFEEEWNEADELEIRHVTPPVPRQQRT